MLPRVRWHLCTSMSFPDSASPPARRSSLVQDQLMGLLCPSGLPQCLACPSRAAKDSRLPSHALLCNSNLCRKGTTARMPSERHAQASSIHLYGSMGTTRSRLEIQVLGCMTSQENLSTLPASTSVVLTA